MYEEPMSKIYHDLGIEPIINATGTYTAYSGSLMHPEVSDAMNQASRAYVVMEELHLAAGRRIAELIGVEAAHVCASATAGVALMGAACVAGCDRERIRRLPDIDGLKDEFIIQRTQRNSYEQAVRLSGGHFVEIEPDPEALRQAINGKTAGVFYIYSWSLVEPYIPLREAAEIAHAQGVPVIVDAASELPPMNNLRRFLAEGADLVVFSGGKGLRGPQASGLVLGRPDLVEACRLNDCPHSAIGRGMKTGKEEIVGLTKAVELYMKRDHQAEMLVWERRVQYVLDQLQALPKVRAWRQLPYGIGQLFPHVTLTWNVNDVEVSYQEFFDQMLNGSPRIVTQLYKDPLRDHEEQARIHVHCLQEGEDIIVARRMLEVLGS
jgi:uncharacterized pyridoxal phosphate-dependent enzyme